MNKGRTRWALLARVIACSFLLLSFFHPISSIADARSRAIAEDKKFVAEWDKRIKKGEIPPPGVQLALELARREINNPKLIPHDDYAALARTVGERGFDPAQVQQQVDAKWKAREVKIRADISARQAVTATENENLEAINRRNLEIVPSKAPGESHQDLQKSDFSCSFAVENPEKSVRTLRVTGHNLGPCSSECLYDLASIDAFKRAASGGFQSSECKEADRQKSSFGMASECFSGGKTLNACYVTLACEKVVSRLADREEIHQRECDLLNECAATLFNRADSTPAQMRKIQDQLKVHECNTTGAITHALVVDPSTPASDEPRSTQPAK